MKKENKRMNKTAEKIETVLRNFSNMNSALAKGHKLANQSVSGKNFY
jgi:hypothetical protein